MTKQNREYRAIEALEEVPAFSSDEEEAQFWATHELGEGLLSRMEAPPEGLLPASRPRAKAISLRIDPDVLAAVKAVAKKRDMPYQTLLKQYVVDRLAVEGPKAFGSTASSVESRKANDGSLRNRSWNTAAASSQRRPELRTIFPRLADQPRVCRHAEAVRRRGRVWVYSS